MRKEVGGGEEAGLGTRGQDGVGRSEGVGGGRDWEGRRGGEEESKLMKVIYQNNNLNPGSLMPEST